MLKNGARSLQNGKNTCKKCESSFKKPVVFKNHNCNPCLTEIKCPRKGIMSPKRKCFIAFFSKASGSMTESAWIEGLSKELELNHVHHKFCGHGGERYLDYID